MGAHLDALHSSSSRAATHAVQYVMSAMPATFALFR